MNWHKAIASIGGIGYLKGGGSIAALVTGIIWWFVQTNGAMPWTMLLVTIVITAAGVFTATRVEKEWGKDSSRVVIDEVSGMCISLLFVPLAVQWMLMAFVLFRFFDIAKPLFIRKAEELQGGWGVMTDDVLAGMYTNLLVQLIIYFV